MSEIYNATTNAADVVDVLTIKGANEILNACYAKFRLGSVCSIFYTDSYGITQIKKFTFKKIFKNSVTNTMLLEIDKYTKIEIQALWNYQNLKILIGQEFNFDIEKLGIFTKVFYLKCPKRNSPLTYKSRKFQIYDIFIDFDRPYNYHRDILKSNNAFLRYIEANIKEPNTSDFIQKIGLAHKFLKYVQIRDYGIIVNISEDGPHYKIICLNRNKIIRSITKSYQKELLSLYDFVLIEENENISKVDRKVIPDLQISKSYISYYNTDANDGFIDGINSADYYFASHQCDFTPEVGLVVEFIPGFNYAKKNLLRPMAYCIKVVGYRNKIAKVITVFQNQSYHYIKLMDILSNENISIKVKISRFPEIAVGDLYSYFQPEIFQNVQPERVYLISKESDSLLNVLEAVKTNLNIN